MRPRYPVLFPASSLVAQIYKLWIFIRNIVEVFHVNASKALSSVLGLSCGYCKPSPRQDKDDIEACQTLEVRINVREVSTGQNGGRLITYECVGRCQRFITSLAAIHIRDLLDISCF